MSEPFIGEIKMVGFDFVPKGFANCDGAVIGISQNQAMFSLLGTRFGGDGRTTFALPDLRGRTPMHQGHGPGVSARIMGQKFGTEANQLKTEQMPNHTHIATLKGVNKAANETGVAGATWAQEADVNGDAITAYSTETPDTAMNPKAISLSNTGGSTAVNNLQPTLVVNFIIATQGIYPPRN
ncbi:phage tail protein [Shewanella psychropiezotolerans]|uniref:Phage tail protein n=1 Tax=Shewanella psychropiezotolerans TaxID=2593655 RepID=A0ABX5X547_9GAMM|nr:tail fiber protein [Shewanella psychropiezotolerans]QDO86468.1 phage tail protein [Shewanella psychropiezotolerans]